MRRTIAIAAAALGLAGCSSFSLDAFKPGPPTVQVQLDSTPQGADALTSVGPGCKTPCSVAVKVPEAGFSVTYTMNRFQSVTIPVQLVQGDPAAVNPNPVVAELQPAGPPPKPVRKRVMKPRKPKPPKAAPAPAAGSPFPDQEQAPAAAAPPPAAAPAPAPPPGR
jgi:hypothetical protein